MRHCGNVVEEKLVYHCSKHINAKIPYVCRAPSSRAVIETNLFNKKPLNIKYKVQIENQLNSVIKYPKIWPYT